MSRGLRGVILLDCFADARNDNNKNTLIIARLRLDCHRTPKGRSNPVNKQGALQRAPTNQQSTIRNKKHSRQEMR
jgi:hypothetical protein